jgi:hypothetical protein
MIELNVVNFITIGIVALIMLAIFHFIGAKFNIPFLSAAGQ